MAPEIHPAELASLLDTAERPRAKNWSLRAALTRYGQPQPQRASEVIQLLRRIESALRPHAKQFEREGDGVWAAVNRDEASDGVDQGAVELLRALREIDKVGDVLAEWAVDRAGERPDALVDGVVADVSARLERLGVPHEERPRPGGRRGV